MNSPLEFEPFAANGVLDQVCVVLREDATPLPLLRQALERLHAVNAPCIVLNRTKASAVDIPATLMAART